MLRFLELDKDSDSHTEAGVLPGSEEEDTADSEVG